MRVYLFLLIIFFIQQSFAIVCEDANHYPMLCRGKQHVARSASWATFFVGINDRGAGQYGEYLAQNTCAWADRPFVREEPNRITFFEGFQHENRSVIDMAVECMADTTCVVEFCARKSDDGAGNLLFYGNGGHIMRWFPTFQ